MKCAMAVRTKCYEVFFFVVPEMTSGLNMVNLEILQGSTLLAAPAVTFQYSFP
jgi:hypothetical protein